MDGTNEGSSISNASTTVDLCRNGWALEDLTGRVHQLPCCIKYDGPTSVSQYFNPKSTGTDVDGIVVEEAYFRGRKLHGTRLQLPPGYSGFVLGKKNPEKDTSFENSNCWETKAKFQDVTVWNHDTLPSKDDALLRTFHWFAVAKALHKPVTLEDLESAATEV